MSDARKHLADAEAQRLADGALPAEEAARLERHLATCASCRAAVEEYRALGDALGDLSLPPLPADFTDGVLARIDARARDAARERRHAALVLAAIAAAAAGAFAIAGASAWAPLVSSAAQAIGDATRAARVGAALVPGGVAARLVVVVAAAGAALPLLLGLARLAPAPRRIEKA